MRRVERVLGTDFSGHMSVYQFEFILNNFSNVQISKIKRKRKEKYRSYVSSTVFKRKDFEVDGVALCRDVPIVEIIEVTASALIECRGLTQGKIIITGRKSGSEKRTSLRWIVELQLSVAGDVSGSAFIIFKDAVHEGDSKDAICLASDKDVGAGCLSFLHWCLNLTVEDLGNTRLSSSAGRRRC